MSDVINGKTVYSWLKVKVKMKTKPDMNWKLQMSSIKCKMVGETLSEGFSSYMY